MQSIIHLIVKFTLTAATILILVKCESTNGLTTFSSFLNNLDSTPQEDLANLQHSKDLNQYSDANHRELSCEELKSCDDQAGYEAIKWLHRQLDDDENGNVDMAESADFFKTDLNHSDANEKQLQFHGNDKHISVDDLWLYWIRSEVHNYTTDDAVEWLLNSVELGQYEDTFRANNVNGTSFPRLACLQSSYLSSTLGIKDPIHKQKIALKAMDLVLFGTPKKHNYFKDLMLVFSFLLAMLGCIYAALQRKNTQNHLKKMLRDMEALQKAEHQLSNLQVELHHAKQEQEAVKTEKIRLEENLLKEGSYPHFYLRDQSSLPNVNELNKICELEEELRTNQEHIARLEDAIEKKQWAPPQQLQYWLQLTHELELKNHNAKRHAAELQLLAAKEGCEKLKRKRSSFLGSFRVAHGSSIDDVDNRILQAKESLAEVTKDLQERLYRWKKIEQLLNMTIQVNRGENELYKQLIGGKKNHQSTNNSIARTGSEGTLIESEENYNSQTNPLAFSTVQQLFAHSFALMTLPGLDSKVYGQHPSLIAPFGKDHYEDHYQPYCDACDQYPGHMSTGMSTNSLTVNNSIKNSYLNQINDLKNLNSQLNSLGRKSSLISQNSLKSKLRSSDLTKQILKRRYSENFIRLPSLITNHKVADLNSSNMNLPNLHYRLHPTHTSELTKQATFNHIKSQSNAHDKKAIQNENCGDEDSTTSEENGKERKPQFALGDGSLKENAIKNGFLITNGKSNTETNGHKEESSINLSQNYSDTSNGTLDLSKSSIPDLDSSKALKKRKSYKFFSGLRKRGSKLHSSQESH